MQGWEDYLIYHIASGQAFFVGVGVILTGVGSSLVKLRGRIIFRRLAVVVGLILVTISATPFPYWFYALVGVLTVTWFVFEELRPRIGTRPTLFARGTVVALWLVAIAWELPYHLVPSISGTMPGQPDLFVIGDSVTAGLSDGETGTWPALLASKHGVIVHDFSQMGATASSAHKRQATRLGDKDGLVLLEIGGNDLLGRTSAAQFQDSLDGLLADVCRPGRAVFMFELPLPPFRNEFGRIQRSLANRHGTTLIPKRIFLNVLMTPGATVDGVHLSRSGQELMAQTVWGLLHSAYE
jgi:acyl-CoA thioesterase-1